MMIPAARVELTNYFSPEQICFLDAVAKLAAARGERSYLVGGVVRDILRGTGVDEMDIDIALEGDVASFIRQLERDWGALLPGIVEPSASQYFKRYLTGKIRFSSPYQLGIDVVDFAGTRSESYPRPGAIPIVQAASLREDLGRRDFSVNAMALSLMVADCGTVFDFHRGQQALARRELEVLHRESFRDDPARILRGLRFTARLGFTFADSTRVLAREALEADALRTLPPRRLFDELLKALYEPALMLVLQHFDSFGVLHALHPEWRWDQAAEQCYSRSGGSDGVGSRAAADPAGLALSVLSRGWSEEAFERFLHDRFELSEGNLKRYVQQFISWKNDYAG